MSSVLTQKEIDQLLTSIHAGEPEDRIPSSRNIKIYDFKRPDKFSIDQIRAISMMHEDYSRLLSDFLSKYLKTATHAYVASVNQLSYGEFIRSIPCPTSLSVVGLNPLGKAVMEIDPALTHKILGYKKQRELTDYDRSIVKKLVKKSLKCLQKAWEKTVKIKPGIQGIETNPQFLQIVPEGEMAVLVTMGCEIGNTEGIINLCYPYQSIKTIKGRLRPMYQFTEFPSLIEKKQPEVKMSDVLDNVKIPLRVELGGKDLPIKVIKEIEEGAIIELDKLETEALGIYAGGELIAKGEVIVIGGNFGIRVTELV